MLLRLAPVGLLALVATSEAQAFAPSDKVWIGIEPQRVLEFHPEVQQRLSQRAAWQEFAARYDWTVRFDEGTGTPHRMSGEGIDIGATDTAEQVERGLRAFLADNERLIGVSVDQLRTLNVEYVDRMDTWYVWFDVYHAGAPVYRGGVTARIKHGNLVLLGADTYGDVPRAGRQKITADEAVVASIAQGHASWASHTDESAQLVWLPQEDDAGVVSLRLVWKTFTRTTNPPGKWVGFVDAENGELLNVHNTVRFLDGTMWGTHDKRTVNGEMSTSPLPYVKITSDAGGTTYTDVTGNFSLEGGTFSALLDGSYLRVRNAAGAEGDVDFAESPTWTTDDATQAEIDSYVFIHHVKEWGMRVAPEVEMSTDRLTSNVNQADVCNAYYDGNVNFFEKGSGCNNTGRIADVNYHEWGHGFHQYSMTNPYEYDGSLGEGVADVVAFLQTGDPTIAPYFQTDGQGIREVSDDRVWPDDYSPSDYDIHYNGLIFGGAMWDLWNDLKAEYGTEEGTAIVTDIFTGLIKGATDIESTYDEAVLADDDDGDLSNGTPHYCQIMEAFGRHGLGPSGNGGGAVRLDHDPLSFQPPDIDAVVALDTVNLASQCFDWSPSSAEVVWRADGGSWQRAPLSLTGDTAQGSIPKQAEGTFVEYYLDVEGSDGSDVTAPTGGEINPFSFYVGDVIEVWCTDLEADDGGFTHELVDGDDVLGADDWQWGIPLGEGGDPAAAASGQFAWGNDLGEGDYNGTYQPEKTNRLLSPVIDTRRYTGTFLGYTRWLSVEDARYDHATIYADDEPVWENWSSSGGEEHHQDDQWAPHAVDLLGAGDDGSVQIAWEIDSDEGLEMGGWTLDDVCVWAPATPDNRLGITDFVAGDEEDGGVTLTWTNPIHAPVERVVVVRNADGWPSGPTDGTVVYEDGAPEPTAAISTKDVEADGGVTYYYAVYAYDGAAWLSWTKEGWNADTGSALGTDDGEDPELKNGGCGCATPGTPSAAWLVGLVGLLGLRRRR